MKRAGTAIVKCAISTTIALASLIGCGSADERLFEQAAPMSQSTSDASALSFPEAALIEAISGTNEVPCSGVVISPHVVVTSAICLHRFGLWRVTVPFAGSQSIMASKASVFDFTKTNPDRHDIGVIIVPSRIDLPKYPTLAEEPVPEGTSAIQLGRVEAGTISRTTAFVTNTVTLKDGHALGFKNDYVAAGSLASGNQGGGILLENHELVAVSSGGQDNLLTMARVDLVSSWLRAQIEAAEDTPSEWIDLTFDAGACKDHPGAPCGWHPTNNGLGYTCAERHPEWENGWTCEK